MACSASTQSILASAVTGVTRITRSSPVLLSPVLPRQRKSANMQVRCMSESDPPQAPLTPPRKPKVSTKFSDVFSFSGPAPERINGRLAMIGFVAALAVELSKGDDVITQLVNGGGLGWFAATSVVLTAASLVPLFQGVSAESKSDGVMTSDAELWNGRFAMVGLVALVFTEFVKGGALV